MLSIIKKVGHGIGNNTTTVLLNSSTLPPHLQVDAELEKEATRRPHIKTPRVNQAESLFYSQRQHQHRCACTTVSATLPPLTHTVFRLQFSYAVKPAASKQLSPSQNYGS